MKQWQGAGLMTWQWMVVGIALLGGAGRSHGQAPPSACGVAPRVEFRGAQTNLSRGLAFEEFTPLASPGEFTNNTPRNFYLKYEIKYDGTELGASGDPNRTLTNWGWEHIVDPFTGARSYVTNGSFTDIRPDITVMFYPGNPVGQPGWTSVPEGYVPYFPNCWTISNMVSTPTDRLYQYSDSQPSGYSIASSQQEWLSGPYTVAMLVANYWLAISNAPLAANWSVGTAQASSLLTSSDPPDYEDTDIAGSHGIYRFAFETVTNKSYHVMWCLTIEDQITGDVTYQWQQTSNSIAGTGDTVYSPEYDLPIQPLGQTVTVGHAMVMDALAPCVTFTTNLVYMCIGSSATVGVGVYPTNAAVSFVPADPGIATVAVGSPGNLVLVGGTNGGITTIQAMLGSNVLACMTVNVVGVTFPANLAVAAGESATFAATVVPADAPVTYVMATNHPGVADVGGAGGSFTLYGLADGTNHIHAMIGTTALCASTLVTVTNVPVVTIAASSPYVCKGSSNVFAVTITPPDTNVTFITEPAGIAGVTHDGGTNLVVAGVAPGTTEIRAMWGGYVLASASVTVVQVDLPASVMVAAGGMGTFQATTLPSPPPPPSATKWMIQRCRGPGGPEPRSRCMAGSTGPTTCRRNWAESTCAPSAWCW